jgi:hypothetical protein
VQTAHRAAVEEFMNPQQLRPNIVGLGVGVKWRNGEPTGEPALLALVTHKMPKDELSDADIVPSTLADMQTDVLEIGYPFAGIGAGVGDLRQKPTQVRTELIQPTDGVTGTYRVTERMEIPEAVVEMLARRARPAEGGYSVGHYKITAGTIATCVYDILPGGSTNPPAHGTGVPSRYYILSNNHVLANSNDAAVGDPILQPGPFDGGNASTDIIARLNRFVPIDFEPTIPREQHRNFVDAAIAEAPFHDIDREIYWLGYVRGWRRKQDVTVGMPVYKTGRTTSFTNGRITAIAATVDVGYGNGRTARFRDQIITTNMSAGGDSGSLVATLVNNTPAAVGLLFAGSSVATIVNQIENVRSLLRIEVAEQIL